MPNTTPIKPTPTERRKAATLMMARSRKDSLMFALDVGIKSVIHGKLSCQSLLIRQTHDSESLCNRAQANPLGSCVLLSLHIRSSHNQAKSLHSGISDREVLDDGLERAS